MKKMTKTAKMKKVAAMKTALASFPGAVTDADLEVLVEQGIQPAEIKAHFENAIASGEFAGADAPEPYVYVGKNAK